MDSSLYAASSVLVAHLRAQEISAHNLANVTTPGFKRHVPLFQPFQAELDSAAAGQGDYVVDFSRGAMEHTGNPLDLAVDGKGFFVLEGPGGYLYTRKGNFSLSDKDLVVDAVGRPVLTDSGSKLHVPSGTREIRVEEGGTVYADGGAIGRVWVVDFETPERLLPAAYTTFADPGGEPAPATVAKPRVVQGVLEGSNTNPVEEMVSMIATLRSFESAQRVIRSIDESLKEAAAAANKVAS